MVNPLNDEEVTRLRQAMENHRARTRKTTTVKGLPETKGRKEVDPIEYARRQRAAILKDEELASSQHAHIIERNKRQWFDKVEDRWRDANVDDPEMRSEVREAILDKVRRFETGKGLNQTSMMFAGNFGRGKTWSAYAYAYELISRGILTPAQVYISTEASLAGATTAGYERTRRVEEILNPRYRFYIIDDVGRAPFPNEEARGNLWYEIINHIYSRRLALVLTTNLATNELSGWFGEATIDRLRHIVGSSGFMTMNDDRDMRKRKGAEWEQNYRSEAPK